MCEHELVETHVIGRMIIVFCLECCMEIHEEEAELVLREPEEIAA